MTFALRLKKSVAHDLKRIGQPAAKKVWAAIHSKLLEDPRGAGKPLKGHAGVYWSSRVGEYRVLYTFSDAEVWVLVIRIAHRREVYRDL